MKAALFI